MSFYNDHQKLLHKVMKELQKRYPEARVFARHVGMFYTRLGTPIKINNKGMADLWGLYNGVHFEIEIKTGRAKQSKDQKKWEKVVKSLGGHYFVVRSVDEVSGLFKGLH